MSGLGPLTLPRAEPHERRPDLLDPSRPRIQNVVKTTRYRAGQVPEYAKDAVENKKRVGPVGRPSPTFDVSSPVSSAKRRRLSVSSQSDDLLNELSQEEELEKPSSRKPVDFIAQGLRRRRQWKLGEGEAPSPVELKAEVLPHSDDEMEGIEETQTRRDLERRKQEMRRLRLEEEKRVREEEQEFEDGDAVASEEGSSEEDSSSDNDEYSRPLPKPRFKSKEKRVALKETLLEEAEKQRRLEEEAVKRKDEKETESRQLLKSTLEALQQEEEAEKLRRLHGVIDDNSSLVLPDDQIHDEEEEFRLWKLREMGRLYRDELIEARFQRELEETERRKKMTEEELLADNAARDKEKPKLAAQGKMNYMQKYYHRGVFFQDVVKTGKETAFDKDFNAPVGEDAIDKSLLPAAMRLRRGEFGRKGRSKHTHLTDVDTTDRTSPWYQESKTKH